MNRRATTWLLAALLAISAGAAVPAARTQSFTSGSAIVWIARERVAQRVLVQPRRSIRVLPAAFPLSEEMAACGRFFAASLYQRPPPFSLR